MTRHKYELTGIEKLRTAVQAFSYVTDTFLAQWTPEQLLRIHAAWKASEWDHLPDRWTTEQAQAAADTGEPPRWNKDGDKPLAPRLRGAPVDAADVASAEQLIKHIIISVEALTPAQRTWLFTQVHARLGE